MVSYNSIERRENICISDVPLPLRKNKHKAKDVAKIAFKKCSKAFQEIFRIFIFLFLKLNTENQMLNFLD